MKFDSTPIYGLSTSPLGSICLAATDKGLAGMWFEHQRHLPERATWKQCPDIRQHAVMQAACEQLKAYFAGTLQDFDLPLDLRGGTAFQQLVWQALLRIPYGKTTSYGALSQRIDKPLAIRAVGTAVGRNPLSIIVPCHRVIGSDGSLTGYAGGLDKKVALLNLENPQSNFGLS